MPWLEFIMWKASMMLNENWGEQLNTFQMWKLAVIYLSYSRRQRNNNEVQSQKVERRKWGRGRLEHDTAGELQLRADIYLGLSQGREGWFPPKTRYTLIGSVSQGSLQRDYCWPLIEMGDDSWAVWEIVGMCSPSLCHLGYCHGNSLAKSRN